MTEDDAAAWATVVFSESLTDGRAQYETWLREHPLTDAELEDAVRLDVLRLATGSGLRVLVDPDLMARRGWTCPARTPRPLANSIRRMALEDPVVITCAISGALANREQCPAIPYTPAEYAAEARRIVDEGGVHIHIHARRPDGTPSYEAEDFIAITQAIKDEIGDAAIINFSTGALGVPVEKRIEYLRACPPDVAALNMGSMNYAKYSARRKEFVFAAVFANPFEEIIALLEAMRELHIKPEHECFDTGHVGSLWPLIDMGVLDPPLHVDFVMGVVGGVPPTARNIAAMVDNLPDGGHHWGVIGIGRVQWRLVAAALTLGGSVRVGLEDNFYLPDGTTARSNGDLIAKAREMTIDQGRRPATVEEARRLLALPVAAK